MADPDDENDGNFSVQVLLEDDDTYLSSEHQEVSQDIRDCTPEKFRQIHHDDDISDTEPGTREDPNGEDDDDEAEEDEEVDRGLQEIFLEAKSMVQLTDYKKKKKKKGSSESNLWQIMKVCRIKEGMADDLKMKDSNAYGKLSKAATSEYYCCCLPCYNDPNVSLTKCLVKPTFNKKGYLDGTGNLTKHMKAKHEDLWSAAKEHSFVYKPETPAASASVSEIHEPSGSVSELPGYKTPSPPKQVKIGNSELYKTAKSKGDKAVMNKFHNLLVEFATNNDISERIVTDHTNCPEFKNMIQFTMEHANQLSGKPDLLPGRFKFQSLRKTKWETLVAAIAWRVRVTRDYWKELLGHPIPFIVLCQDVWESKKKDVLGVTIMFLDPVAGTYEQIPIGLSLVGSKKSDELSEQILGILFACGIHMPDLYKSANDTTNSSAKIGFLLTGEKGRTHQQFLWLHMKLLDVLKRLKPQMH